MLSAANLDWSPFIGLKDTVGDNQVSSYKWLKDDSSLSYTNWENGEPSGSDEVCVEIRQDNGRWNDISCGMTITALCEAEMVMFTLDYYK